jgi:4-hydroxythreonine-4-phosphate dehydrogenase
VTALNPHAGEGGLFGREEISVISPEIRALRAGSRGRFVLDGPLPADTLFANHSARKPAERHDAVVCMYHDQGLIPVKLLDFGGTVNVTLGLPIIRTSVDHGVAFDLAGTGRADPSSFRSALELAETLIKRR